jgi:hypothetical protein
MVVPSRPFNARFNARFNAPSVTSVPQGMFHLSPASSDCLGHLVVVSLADRPVTWLRSPGCVPQIAHACKDRPYVYTFPDSICWSCELLVPE